MEEKYDSLHESKLREAESFQERPSKLIMELR